MQLAACDTLEMGDADTVAVRARDRNQARHRISRESGRPYAEVGVSKKYLRVCDCESCEEIGPARAHGYDEFWQYCGPGDPGATVWWVEA